MCCRSVVTLATLLVALQTTPGGELQGSSWIDRSPHRVRLIGVDENVQLEVLDWGGSGRPIVLLSWTRKHGARLRRVRHQG